MSHPVTMKRSRLTIAVSAALAGISFAQPAWSACTVDGTTITVNTITDVTAPGPEITFREAVTLANDPDCDTINFDAALNGQTITLASSVNTNASVNIVGPGSSLLTITGTSYYALNTYSGDIDISGLTFDGSGSKVSIDGATTAIADDIVIKNTNGTGLYISNSTTVAITNSTFRDNSSNGINIYADATNVNIANCTMTTNDSRGIYIYSSATSGPSTITIDNTTVDGNDSYNGAGIYVSPSSSAAGDSITISNSTISNNTTNGILDESNISAGSGGGILVQQSAYDYDLTIVQSTISGNTANAAGGGIFIGDRTASSTININHSTISNNTAVYGGGLLNSGTGADVNLSNSVISGNTASSADLTDEDIGSGWDPAATTGTVQAAGNTSSNYSFVGVNHTNVTDAGTGSILNGGDAKLAALADGGAGTKVHVPASDSLLVNMGDPALTAGTGSTPTTDQADNPRVDTARIDIGSVEYQTPVITPVTPAATSSSSSLGMGVYLLGLLTSVLGFARYRRKINS